MYLTIKKKSATGKKIMVGNIAEALAKFIYSKEMNMIRYEDFNGCFIYNKENKPLYKVDWDRNIFIWDGKNNNFTDDDIPVIL